MTVLGVLAAPLIIYVSAPGFAAAPGKFQLTVDLLRITFPYILFISLTALAGGVLNTYSRFWVPAFTPALLNLSFIAFALWLAPYFDPPVTALAWAVLSGRRRSTRFSGAFPRAARAAAPVQAELPGRGGEESHRGRWGPRSSACRSPR